MSKLRLHKHMTGFKGRFWLAWYKGKKRRKAWRGRTWRRLKNPLLRWRHG